MAAIVKSIALSIVVSAASTYLARVALSLRSDDTLHDSMDKRHRRGAPIVVIVPMLIGNSNNRIGYFKHDTPQ